MPIRREYRRLGFYGPEWRAYRLVLIERAGNTCARCGDVLPSHELCGAHVTHDPRSSEVQVLCFPCHGRLDWPHSRAVARRTLAKRHGQLWLAPEIEYACFPLWLAPRQLVLVRKPEQGSLWEAA